jgi:hypothetical protein
MRKKMALAFVLTVGAAIASVAAQEDKVTICHIPPGNPANAHTITVGASAVPAHVNNHGDGVGACGSGDQ